MRLAGKVAVITGAAHGIGRAAALLFAREGARVVAGDIDQAALAALAGPHIHAQSCDVTDAAALAGLVEAAERLHGRLDILFSNAGHEQLNAPAHEVPMAEFDRLVAVHLRGTMLAIRHAVPAMLRAGGGSIVTNSSVGAFASSPGTAAYAAAKAGILALTRVAALDYAAQGIRANAIAPGVIDTGMNARNLARSPDPAALVGRWRSITPLGRMGTAEEAAEAALWLASDASSFVTGTALVVDGGRLAL